MPPTAHFLRAEAGAGAGAGALATAICWLGLFVVCFALLVARRASLRCELSDFGLPALKYGFRWGLP